MERFLAQCVESVLAQNVDGMEVILVDDRSPDGCPALCDRIACSDAQVRVVHRTENGGLSAARNSGLDIAEGRYVTFVDSDDFLSPQTYAPNIRLLESANADTVEFPVEKGYGGDTPTVYNPAASGAAEESFDEWMARDGFVHSYAWNKIFHRKLWAGTRFPAGKYFEDLFTIPYILRRACKMAVSAEGLYHYRINPESITGKPSPDRQRDLLQASAELLDYLRKAGYSDSRLYNLYMETVNRRIDCLRLGIDAPIPDFRIRLRHVLRNQPPSRRAKALALLVLGETAFKLFP